jgi:GT2 family glycosyltransferase
MGQQSVKAVTDIVIPVLNHYHLTRDLLEGIYRYTSPGFHIYVIDNGSTDETVDLHKIYTRNITVVRNRKDLGWAGAVNQGIQMGSNPSVVIMSHSISVSNGWLDNLTAFLDSHPRIAAVGPLYSNSDQWQCVERIRKDVVPQIPHFFTEDLHERNRILSYHFHRTGILVEGDLAPSCLAVKRRVLDDVGHFDEVRAKAEGSTDCCRRLRQAGYVIGLSLDTCVSYQGNNREPAATASGRRAKRMG